MLFTFKSVTVVLQLFHFASFIMQCLANPVQIPKIARDIKIGLIRYLHVQLSFVRHPYRKQPTPTTAATISILV